MVYQSFNSVQGPVTAQKYLVMTDEEVFYRIRKGTNAMSIFVSGNIPWKAVDQVRIVTRGHCMSRKQYISCFQVEFDMGEDRDGYETRLETRKLFDWIAVHIDEILEHLVKVGLLERVGMSEAFESFSI